MGVLNDGTSQDSIHLKRVVYHSEILKCYQNGYFHGKLFAICTKMSARKKFHVFNFNINNGLPKRLASRMESKKIIYRTYLQSSVAHIEICARVCFLFIHSLEPILFYFMWMADEKRMRMKAR